MVVGRSESREQLSSTEYTIHTQLTVRIAVNSTYNPVASERQAVNVFVYGTLTDPERVDAVLGESDREVQYADDGPATLEGLHRVHGRYPTLAPGGSVDGRLLAVDEAGLEALDRYEGVDRGLYARVPVPRSEEHAGEGTVWTYVGDPARLGADDVDWPDGESFADRVRAFVARNEIVVRRDE